MKICGRGKLIDCEGVLTSRYSRVFGIPLSEIGMAFHGGLLLLLVTAGAASDGASIPAAAGIAFVATIPASVVLIGLQVRMRQFCTLCLVIHAVNLAGATTAIVMLRDLDPPWPGTGAAFLLLALLFMLILFFVIPYALGASRIDKQLGALRRIQGSPFVTLAQILSGRPRDISGAGCGIAITDPAGPNQHELVVFVHPGCTRCWTVMQELGRLAETGATTIYIAVAPKDETEEDEVLCTRIVAAGISGGPAALLQAYSSAKEYLSQPASRRRGVTEAIDGRLSGEEVLGSARRLVSKASFYASRYTEGTPALFLDGRPVAASPAHIVFLLSEHRELLEPLLVRRSGRVDDPEEATG